MLIFLGQARCCNLSWWAKAWLWVWWFCDFLWSSGNNKPKAANFTCNKRQLLNFNFIQTLTRKRSLGALCQILYFFVLFIPLFLFSLAKSHMQNLFNNSISTVTSIDLLCKCYPLKLTMYICNMAVENTAPCNAPKPVVKIPKIHVM